MYMHAYTNMQYKQFCRLFFTDDAMLGSATVSQGLGDSLKTVFKDNRNESFVIIKFEIIFWLMEMFARKSFEDKDKVVEKSPYIMKKIM